MQLSEEKSLVTPAAKDDGGVERICDQASRVLEQLLAYAFIGAVLLNFANVIDRYVFSRSIIGADEIEVLIMVGTTFLGAAVVTWRNSHLRMDVLARALPRPARTALKFAEIAFFIAFVGTIFVESVIYAQQMYVLGVTSDTARLPMWIPHGAVALGLGLMAVAVVLRNVGTHFRRANGVRSIAIEELHAGDGDGSSSR
jgi:TRAP-type C4-dicarboxylate transport system permease small subunit